jgi:hypothetical protein
VQGKWCWHFWPLDSAKETCKHMSEYASWFRLWHRKRGVKHLNKAMGSYLRGVVSAAWQDSKVEESIASTRRATAMEYTALLLLILTSAMIWTKRSLTSIPGSILCLFLLAHCLQISCFVYMYL